ncbi:MAG TPA: PAS domain S-box protein, partial [Chitinophagaceae bacterium]|nr:PAS domain S-box protein [Chitinophagaceae bacterium]
ELVFQNEEKEKRAAELITANRFYSFISAINQTIVHAENEQTVFKEACRIATEVGKFEFALITIPDEKSRKLEVVAHSNAQAEDLEFFKDLVYDIGGPTAGVFRSGTLHIINDYENELSISGTKKFASERGLKSCILLPIKKSGKTIGVYNLYSTSADLFDQGEIALLEEAVGDISFALNVFEKEKHRKQMEQKVIHSELQLKQAQAIAHFGNWEMNFSNGIGTWSDEACRIFGIEPDDNVQSYQTWLSFIHPDDLAYVMEVTKAEQERESNTAFHHRIIRKDGAVRHIFSQAHFELNTNGKPVGLYSVVHDVTETKEAEESLAQSEANLRQIMNLLPQSISAKDYTGKYVFVNNSFASLYGLTAKELIGKSVMETIPVADEADMFLRQDLEVILSGETKTIPEDTFTDHKGNKCLLYTIKVPFTVAGTNEKAVLGISVDITEQKLAETERTKMVADIVQRNKNLEQFSYIVSHNLRAPVANILGLTNIIETIGLEKGEEKKVIVHLGSAARNLDNVIRDINYILELKQQISENRQSVKFSTLLGEIRSSIANVILEAQVQIIADFSAIDEILTIKSYLYSIFFNLISNSIKYRQSGIPPVIEITSLLMKNKIRLVFKDNGLGINMNKKGGEVFGLYKRFHDHVEGKGMGLFMVKTQVETLGGTVAIASEVNVGTEFVIEFEINA